MTALLLVRHAAHDNVGRFLAGRMAGVRLGADGRAQADRLGRRLVRERLDAIHASPRERTLETALAIARASALPAPTVVEALDEIDFGHWSGHDFTTLNADPAFRHWNEERASARTPAGESMGDVQTRAMAHLDQVALTERGRRIAIVTHADVIKAVICRVLDLPLGAWWRFDVAPASITTLAVAGEGMRLCGLNEVVW